ncbi:MAG: hypothetical protein AAFR98_05440 [Pseudomonadota bacterium]
MKHPDLIEYNAYFNDLQKPASRKTLQDYDTENRNAIKASLIILSVIGVAYVISQVVSMV